MPPSSEPFQLRVLGPTELVGLPPDREDANVRAPKRLALLVYLALETADGFRRRDEIVAVFWPDLGQEAARTQLRKSLSAIREDLGQAAVITRGDSEVRLDESQVWCDAVALERAIREEHWEEALALYRGELLAGLFPGRVAEEFHTWLGERRKALRALAAMAAWECSREEEVRGDRKAAAALARKALELAPDDEEGIRRLMTLLDRHGDRGGALRVYAEWQERLQREYSVEPAPETRKLARRVQAARKGESHETPPMPFLPSPPLHDSAVAASVAPSQSPASPNAPSSKAWRARRARWMWLVGGSAVVAGIVLFTAMSMADDIVIAPLSVAILPLRVVGDSAVVATRVVVEEEIATSLIMKNELLVAPASGRAIPDSTLGARDLGRRMRVAYVVEGGIRAHGDGIRLTLRCVRTSDGIALWASSQDLARGAVDLDATALAGSITSRILSDTQRASGSRTSPPAGQAARERQP